MQNSSPEKMLFANQQTAKSAMGHRYLGLDWKKIENRRELCRLAEEEEPWRVKAENFLLLPQMLPSSDQTAKIYDDLNIGFELGDGIEQYIDVHGKDPHLLRPLLQLRQVVADQGFDQNESVTTADHLSPYFLIAFGTGDGRTLRSLINHYRPYHLVIALADWHDFATSFWEIDWQEISARQEINGKGKITIGCYKDSNELLGFLLSECHAGIDHALLYLPPKGGCDPQTALLREGITKVELSNSISYLGYTIDEHNMVWNTWQTLSRKPRIFRQPQKPMGGRMVVCGSGPSLDTNLGHLRELSRTHWITACGSNIRTLKMNNIRVDFLALVEREDLVALDMEKVVTELGSGQTRLVMSSTCHHQLLSLFADSMVFFRPALTPLALFSNSPAEVLNFEGPETINTGVALAAALGMDELVLVGVDLGARTLQKLRSDEAQGWSARDLDLEAPANFGGTVFTSRLLRDSRMSVEACLRCYKQLKVFNASDGAAIEGAQAQLAIARVQSCIDVPPLESFEDSPLGQWWISSARYTPQRFVSSWASRRPRAEVAALVTSLKGLFRSQELWNPVVIQQITRLLALDVPPAVQFPRRVLRSTIHKLVIAVNRQLMVMAADPQKMAGFERAARRILADLLNPLEDELYALCDAVEDLPVQPCENALSEKEFVVDA
ncbi:6-hydroxymethylpterin diphosphokinase MptE-like protein [Synechococcus sp. HK01-R]|uniref:6-hydroxymethylpterin diphosphokinase MptE-like protein n=1 Tax=Synechococcus sp. HK01-R TaxID=2751171 RepID=UPI0021058E4C|nr:6-hydroxymethylpterin diphosphokinase MptE-like protein [Synechococcus sp. HK01-R]